MWPPRAAVQGAEKWGGTMNILNKKIFVVCAQYIVKLLNKIRGYSINNRDFLS
jgi:hypothetical protein